MSIHLKSFKLWINYYSKIEFINSRLKIYRINEAKCVVA